MRLPVGRARRLADRRPRQPGLGVRRHPPQHRLRGRQRARRAVGAAARPKSKYRGLLTEGRAGPGGPRVAVLLPQTYMNDAGQSVGPARGALKVPLDHVLVHPRRDRSPVRGDPDPDRRRARRPQRAEVAQGRRSARADFARVRVGVGRPPTTDPDRVAAYVLGRFREPREEVAAADRAGRRRGRAVVLGRGRRRT